MTDEELAITVAARLGVFPDDLHHLPYCEEQIIPDCDTTPRWCWRQEGHRGPHIGMRLEGQGGPQCELAAIWNRRGDVLYVCKIVRDYNRDYKW